MKKIPVIIKKEFTDIVRDKRTLFTMIVIPLLLFPIIFNVMGTIASHQETKEKEKQLTVGIVGENNALQIMQLLRERKDIQLNTYKTIAETDTLIKTGKLDGALEFENGFDLNVKGLGAGKINLYYKSANWGIKDRLMQIIEGYKNTIIEARLAALKITKEAVDPVQVRIQDVSTPREVFGKTAGGFLPYIFVIFTFMGCMYPAIDLFTNEKERGTLETILTTPVNRLEILFGKMTVVSMVGFTSAMLSMIGLSLGLHQFSQALPQEMMKTLMSFIQPKSVLMLLSMLLPLTVFFAGVLTLIATYAKSYKEAQSIISPMMILVITPAVVGLMPGIEINALTALIPITNISLASKEIIAGTMNTSLYILVLASLLIYAGIAVFAATRWFSNESNIIKN